MADDGALFGTSFFVPCFFEGSGFGGGDGEGDGDGDGVRTLVRAFGDGCRGLCRLFDRSLLTAFGGRLLAERCRDLDLRCDFDPLLDFERFRGFVPFC